MDDIIDLVSRSDDDLRALIIELEAEEREISRRRRILHGKLDILRAELVMRLQHKHNQVERPSSPPTTYSGSRASSPASGRGKTSRPAKPRRPPRTPGSAEVFCP